MGMLSWRWWTRNKTRSLDDAALASGRFDGGDRRHLLQALSVLAGGGALAVLYIALKQKTRATCRRPSGR